MTGVWVACALVGPWAAGAALVHVFRERGESWTLRLGAGWLVGQTMVMAMLYFTLVATGAARARLILLLLVAVMAVALVLRSRGGTDVGRLSISAPGGGPAGASFFYRVLLGVVGACLVAKLFVLAGAHAAIPIRGDDAISTWLFKAKVVTELGRLPLDPGQDYYLGGSNPHYPVFVSLIAAWVPLVTGHWHEQLATLSWLFYFVNLVLLVAGGLRRWLPVGESWIAAYCVASLPLVAVHVYRPGYADLILAVFLTAGVLYLLAWRTSNLMRHLILAGVFLLSAACLKRESPPLALITALAFLVTSWRQIGGWRPRARLFVGLGAAASVAIVMAVVDFSEQVEAVGALAYRPEVWPRLWQHLFGWSSFQFLFGALAAGLAVTAVSGRSPHTWPVVLLAVGLAGFHAAVFLFTPQARFALNDQTPSRLFLQIAPALAVALAVTLFGARAGAEPNRRLQ